MEIFKAKPRIFPGCFFHFILIAIGIQIILMVLGSFGVNIIHTFQLEKTVLQIIFISAFILWVLFYTTAFVTFLPLFFKEISFSEDKILLTSNHKTETFIFNENTDFDGLFVKNLLCKEHNTRLAITVFHIGAENMEALINFFNERKSPFNF